jgi:phosphoserine phosphatase
LRAETCAFSTIGQAVIHDALALGMLVELTDEMKSSTLLTDLLLEAHRPRRADSASRLSQREEYDAWVRAQGKGRYIVSVLGPNPAREAISPP